MTSLQAVHGDAFGRDGIVGFGEVHVLIHRYQRQTRRIAATITTAAIIVVESLNEEIVNGGREINSIGQGETIRGHVAYGEGERTGTGHDLMVM